MKKVFTSITLSYYFLFSVYVRIYLFSLDNICNVSTTQDEGVNRIAFDVINVPH